MKLQSIMITVMLAALYAVLVILLAPISFSIIQVRVADALLPLSIIFGAPAVAGLTIGTLVANLFSPFGIQVIDLFGGALANLLATYTAWKIATRMKFRGSWLFAVTIQVLIITFIIGSYLVVIIPIEVQENMSKILSGVIGVKLPLIVVSWIGVLGGSLVAILIIGYSLLRALVKFLRLEER